MKKKIEDAAMEDINRMANDFVDSIGEKYELTEEQLSRLFLGFTTTMEPVFNWPDYRSHV